MINLEASSRGGKSRAKNLTKERKSEISSKAAKVRWEKTLPFATHTGHLMLGGATLECAVLNNGKRVITATAIEQITGLRTRKWVKEIDPAQLELSEHEKTNDLRGEIDPARDFQIKIPNNFQKFSTPEIEDRLVPVKFRMGISIAHGFDCAVLVDICDFYLRAREDGSLAKNQYERAQRCESILRSIARVGMIALVDEATGFELDKRKDDLQELLKQFVSEELRRWVRTFPQSYFRELCRLRGVPFREERKLPQYFGVLTNDIIYKRLAPYVLEELKKKQLDPVSGKKRGCMHQWLTEEIGHPKLLQHLGGIITLMRLNQKWDKFKESLDQLFPKFEDDGSQQLHLKSE